MVVDPSGGFLYVVNSNSDLRFNAGTVVAVDLQAVCDREPDWDIPGCPAKIGPSASASRDPACTKTRFSRTENVGEDYCCRDMVDSNVINCNDPQFIQSDATIEIGSFGGAVQLQRFFASRDRTGLLPVRRLLVAVRAEPSITYADVTVQDDGTGRKRAALRCTGLHGPDAPAQPENAFCDDNWRVRRPGGATSGELVLPEEPYVMSLDYDNQSLFVGHLTVSANNQVLGGGVSSLDICDPQYEPWRQAENSTLDPSEYEPVHFAGLAHDVFLPSSTLLQAVAGLSGSDGKAEIYATARYSTAVTAMVFQSPVSASSCDPGTPRDLTLIPGQQFFAPALSPNGVDVRNIVFDGNRAFVLHRNDTMNNAAAIEVLDRTPLPDGTPSNTPIDVLQVCNGPTVMQKAPDSAQRNRLFVTCYDDGRIYIIDTQALAVSAEIDVGTGPTSLVFSNDGNVGYVASFADSHLALIDLRPASRTENRVVLRIGLPHGYGE
jgi:YVTN family beta-propeller protein